MNRIQVQPRKSPKKTRIITSLRQCWRFMNLWIYPYLRALPNVKKKKRDSTNWNPINKIWSSMHLRFPHSIHRQANQLNSIQLFWRKRHNSKQKRCSFTNSLSIILHSTQTHILFLVSGIANFFGFYQTHLLATAFSSALSQGLECFWVGERKKSSHGR